MSFSFYCVEPSYCDYLREYDPKVPYTMDKKSTRPFIGIVLNINGFDYFAPLTSPKPKHLKMKNQIDFLKINNGIWGAINFNNKNKNEGLYSYCDPKSGWHNKTSFYKSPLIWGYSDEPECLYL